MSDNDYSEIFAAYTGIEPIHFELEYTMSTMSPEPEVEASAYEFPEIAPFLDPDMPSVHRDYLIWLAIMNGYTEVEAEQLLNKMTKPKRKDSP